MALKYIINTSYLHNLVHFKTFSKITSPTNITDDCFTFVVHVKHLIIWNVTCYIIWKIERNNETNMKSRKKNNLIQRERHFHMHTHMILWWKQVVNHFLYFFLWVQIYMNKHDRDNRSIRINDERKNKNDKIKCEKW